MEPSWEIIKGAMQWLVFPLIAGLSYFCKDYFGRVRSTESEVMELKIRVAVTDAYISEIKKDIKEIKYNVEKLVDRN